MAQQAVRSFRTSISRVKPIDSSIRETSLHERRRKSSVHVIQLRNKKRHRARHSDSTCKVTKVGPRQRSLPKVDPVEEPLTQSIPISPQNFASAENTEQQLAGRIHSTDGSELNTATNVIASHPSNSVSYISESLKFNKEL